MNSQWRFIMKRLIILSAIIFALTSFTTEAKKHHHYVGSYFYTELAPYGQWIEIDYGVVVWRPTIMRINWLPYSQGRWIWTADGWYWDSYEPFGYITYHYGRWFYDDYYGWLWYPDYEWAPAWVEWRYSNDYIGWAPLHPYASFSISIGIFFTTTYYSPYNHWHFVNYRRFCDPYVYNYYVPPRHRYRIYSNTRYRTNYTYYNGRVQNRGIGVEYVRVRSGQKIKKRDVIRVRDPKNMRNGRHGSRDVIRTLDVPRDQLARNDVRTMDIKRDNRRTSLDMNKVKIGDKNRNRKIVRDDKVVKRNKNGNDINKVKREKKNSGFDKRTVTTKRNNDKKVNRKKEVVNKNKNVRTNKNVFDRKDTKKRKTTNVITKKKNDNKRKINNNGNRNNKQKVQKNNTRKTEVKRNKTRIQKKNNDREKQITRTEKKRNNTRQTRDVKKKRNDGNKNTRQRR